MAKYQHEFVENYDGFLAFGMDRKTDESTVICYLQMLSDDTMMKHLIKKMSDEELDNVFTFVSTLLKSHISESEYHHLFLRDDHQH